MKTIIIAGLTRSGLTVTMQMLHAGGYPCFGNYPAFEEYEIGHIDFIKNSGKAIKVVDTHRQFPPKGEYHVIRLTRNMSEQAKSFAKFGNIMLGLKINKKEQKIIEKSFPSDYAKIDSWAKKQEGFIKIAFEDIIDNPKKIAEEITAFVGVQLDVEKMANVVVKRSSDCYPILLEATFV